MIITLREEIENIAGNKTKSINMREPTRADYKAVQNINGDIAKEDALISRLTGIPIDMLDQLVIADSLKLQNKLMEMSEENYDPKHLEK